MDCDKFSITVRSKKKFIREVCKEREKKNVLLDQVEVCEALGFPLTEEYIVLLVKMPLKEMVRSITLHKIIYPLSISF